MEPKKKKKLAGQQGELMRALNITVDDLIANDEGYISEEQQESVLKRQSYQWQQFKVLPAVFSGLGMLFLVIASVNSEDASGLFALTGFFLLMAAFFGIIGILQRQRLQQELAKNKFESTQGIAVVNVGDQKSHLEINGFNLNASPDVLRRVQHLQPYLIHYLPETKVILSMEHISETNNIREDQAQSRLQDQQSDDHVMTYDEPDTMESNSTV